MSPIQVVINGAAGKMGRMIAAGVHSQDDMQVAAGVEAPGSPHLGQDAGELAGVGFLEAPVVDTLETVIDKADVLIEFTRPGPTLQHLRAAARTQTPFVIATTGFEEEELAEISELAQQTPTVMAPNFSVGVNTLIKAVALVAETLGDAYDIEIVEAHHNEKVDAPSGTAVRLADVAAEAVGRSMRSVGVYGRHGIVGARKPKEIGVHAVRGGDIVGDHTVMFAGKGERIELVHRSQSREAFASGAIRAARWIVSAPKGLHSFDDVLFGQD